MPHFWSCLARAWDNKCMVTVEPALFLASLGFYITDTAAKVLMYKKVCIMLLGRIDGCVSRNLSENEQILVQQDASIYEFYRTLTLYLPVVLLGVIFSNLVDRWSKKHTMLFFPIGSTLTLVVYLLGSIYMESSPGYMLLGALMTGLSGGILTMMGASYTYLSATAPENSLIIRLSIADAALMASTAISSAVSGILVDEFGLIVVYLIAIAINVLLTLYISVRLHDISLSAVFTDSKVQASQKSVPSAIIYTRGHFGDRQDSDSVSSRESNMTTGSETTKSTKELLKCIESVLRKTIEKDSGHQKVTRNESSDNLNDFVSTEIVKVTNFTNGSESGSENSKNVARNIPSDTGKLQAVTEELEQKPLELTADDAELTLDDLDDNKTSSSSCSAVFNWFKRIPLLIGVYIKDYVRIVVKRRADNKRRGISALLALLLIAYTCLHAFGSGLSYLYVTHEPLSWSTAMYGYYRGVVKGVNGLCLLVLPLTKSLNVPYTIFIIISIVSATISSAVLAVSFYTWMAYLSAILGIFEAVLVVAARSLIVNLVDESEHGKAFGMVAALESLSFVLSAAIFNLGIYPATVEIFSGLAIFIASAILLIPLGIAIWLHIFLSNMVR